MVSMAAEDSDTDSSKRRMLRSMRHRLYDILPPKLKIKFSCLALEEKRIGAVSLDPTLCEDFLTSYKRKIKDNFIPIEFKVSMMNISLFAPAFLGSTSCEC
mgnify:FL=1